MFTGFTLSQSGLVVHWSRNRPPHWRRQATINGVGATATAVATMVFILTKFTEGAWVVVIAVPAFIFLFSSIHRYYRWVGRALGLGDIPGRPQVRPTMVVVPVAAVSRLAQYAVGEALSISDHVIAVTVVLEDADGSTGRGRELEQQWARWNPGVPLRVLHTEYASVAEPVVAFIDSLCEHHDKQIVVLIPVVLPDKLRYEFLHNHYDLVLSAALRGHPDVVSARISMPLELADGEHPTGSR